MTKTISLPCKKMHHVTARKADGNVTMHAQHRINYCTLSHNLRKYSMLLHLAHN